MYSSEIIENLPKRPLSNYDILKCVDRLKIPYFRGVFMRDALPLKIKENESAIVNLDSIKGEGTHWVCYFKEGFHVQYFDSFGNLKPPIELQKYFNSGAHRTLVRYNYFPRQQGNTVNCGHLCLDFLAVRR
jgi:hypothetical protein